MEGVKRFGRTMDVPGGPGRGKGRGVRASCVTLDTGDPSVFEPNAAVFHRERGGGDVQPLPHFL